MTLNAKDRQRAITFLTSVLFLVCLGLACPGMHAQSAAPAAGPESAFSIPKAQLLQPEALHGMLQARNAEKPLVLQVGFHVLFTEAHIPGAEYAGPAAEPSGLQNLQTRVSKLPRNKLIVIYCGCCPWSHCPNIGTAFQKLRQMGFTNVKALYLADNFGADWVNKGFPVARGQ
ncbi:MAG: rhodanese-like domain-containing protein [Acidobacteriota bacterium]|nr:rhodanese-like domain-containing protein [Acidobacteriota bacterium]